MKKLFTITMLLFSIVAFSQTEYKIKSFQYAKENQKLSEVEQHYAFGTITLFDNYIDFQMNNEINDTLFPTSELIEETIDNIPTITFTARTKDENIVVRFAGEDLMLIMFMDKSILAIEYGE